MSIEMSSGPALDVRWREHALNVGLALSAVRYVPRVPKAMPEDLFPGVDDLEISMRHDVRARSLPHGEAYVLSLITAAVQPGRIFEIGTASGQATLLMARQAPNAAIDTIDLGNDVPSLGTQVGEPPWVDLSTIGLAWRDTPFAERITQHFADSATFDYGPFREQIDLVFIDGAHTYDYVKSDTRAAMAMLTPGGVIVWDDCNYVCPGVSKLLVELRAAGHQVHRIYGTRFGAFRAPATA